MRVTTRVVVGAASVAAIAVVVLVALPLEPRESRVWLSLIGAVAVGMSISSVIAEPRELLAALVLGAAPVMGLAGNGSTAWLIGPLGVLLLVGAELNAWSWELGGGTARERDPRRRVGAIMQLAVIGLLSAAAVAVAARSAPVGGLVAVTLAAVALAGLGSVILPRGRGSTEA